MAIYNFCVMRQEKIGDVSYRSGSVERIRPIRTSEDYNEFIANIGFEGWVFIALNRLDRDGDEK